jgi:hypothetical protein
MKGEAAALAKSKYLVASFRWRSALLAASIKTRSTTGQHDTPKIEMISYRNHSVSGVQTGPQGANACSCCGQDTQAAAKGPNPGATRAGASAPVFWVDCLIDAPKRQLAPRPVRSMD